MWFVFRIIINIYELLIEYKESIPLKQITWLIGMLDQVGDRNQLIIQR